jgi:hypothetical protein
MTGEAAARAVGQDDLATTTGSGKTAGGDAPISISSSGMTQELPPPKSYAAAAQVGTTIQPSITPTMSCKSSGTYSIQVHVGDDGEVIPVLTPSSPLYNPSDSHPSAGATALGLSPENSVADAIGHIINIIQGQDPLSSSSDPTQPLDKPSPPAGPYYHDHPGDGWYKYLEGWHTSKAVWQGGEHHDKEVGHYLQPQLKCHKPVLLGTMGRGQPVYVMPLQAEPYTQEVPATFHAPPIESLVYPFDLWIKRGLANLGDYRVTTDVMQL